MKRNLLLASAVALSCVTPPLARADTPMPTVPPSAVAPLLATSTDFFAAQTTWKEVRELTQELDALVAQRKLGSVHEAAFNVRDAVRELRFGSQALPSAAQTKLDGLIRQVDALAGELDATGDRNDLKGTVQNQRRLRVLLDGIVATFPKGVLQPLGALTAQGPVKDPYCRMTVDPSTAAGRVAYGGQTYYFCSASEAQAFAQNPTPYAKLYDDLLFGKPKVFNIGLTTSGSVKVGQPAQLVFAVRQQGQTSQVRSFQLVHERLMHLIMVSDDLTWFAHEHPELAKDGRFYMKWTPPRAGRYWLFSDFTPSDGTNQILRTEVRVGGGAPRPMTHLVPDKTRVTTIDGYQIAVKVPPMRAGQETLLTYTITQSGKPVTDMQPYLGAMGHMMAIHQNGRDAVHTHTVSAGSDPHTGLTVTPAMATPHGPAFSFKLTLPTAGIYRVWAQFQRGSQVLTVPFTFQAQGDPMKFTQPAVTTALVASVALSAATTAHAAPKKTAPPKAPPAKVQRITIALPAGYKLGAATVKSGRPVALTFKLASDAGCGNTVMVPAAHWTKKLKVGQSATVMYTPRQSGALKFACSMDMYKGTVVVK